MSSPGWLRRHLVLDRLSIGLVVFVVLALAFLGYALSAGAPPATTTTTVQTSSTTHTLASASFALSPASGEVGTLVSGRLGGFDCSGGYIVVTMQTSGFSTRIVGNLTFARTAFTFSLPSAVHGQDAVTATGIDGCQGSASSEFDVNTATIALSHTQGEPGNNLTISGSGFSSLANFQSVSVCNSTVTLTAAQTNVSGSFTGATFALPSSCQASSGSLQIQLTDSTGVEAESTFQAGASVFWYCFGAGCAPSSTQPSTTLEVGQSSTSSQVVVRISPVCLSYCSIAYPFTSSTPWNSSSFGESGFSTNLISASNSAGTLPAAGPYTWTNSTDVVTVTLAVADRAGNYAASDLFLALNQVSSPNVQQGTGVLVRADVEPRVTLSFPVPNGSNGWYTDKTVYGVVSAYQPSALMNDGDITCSDSVGTPLLSSPSSSPSLVALNFTVSLSGNGVHELSCTAVDNLGDAGSGPGSTPTPMTLKLDAAPPSVSVYPSREPDSDGWYNHTLYFSVNGSDLISGISSCAPIAAYSGPDNSTAKVFGVCTDNAGNTASTGFSFEFDSTPPIVSVTSPGNGTVISLSSVPGRVVISGTASDSESGVSSVRLAVNDGNLSSATTSNGWSQWSYSANFSSRGDQGFTVLTSDYAGNIDELNISFKVGDVADAAVACSPDSVGVGANTTCTAKVSDLSVPSTFPLGNVTFSTGGSGQFTPSSTCSLTVKNHTSTCSVEYAPAAGSEGSQVIGVSYSGDGDHAPTKGSTFLLTVTKRVTTTTFTCTPSSSEGGGSVSCIAQVTALGGVPTGKVTFTSASGTFTRSSCDLLNGQCGTGFTLSVGAQGSVTVSASYDGDSDDSTSTGSFSISVGLRSTTTGVACSPTSDPVDSPSTCDVTVSDTSGTSPPPGGDVSLSSSQSGAFSGSCVLSGSGSTSTCSVTYTPAPGSEGTATINATFPGDSEDSKSSGVFSVSAVQRSTTASLSCAPVGLLTGSSTDCTFELADSTVSGTPLTPGGTATLSANESGTFSPSDSCVLSGSAGSSSCSVTFTPSVSTGYVNVGASWDGDQDHPSNSAQFVVSVGLRSTSTSIICSLSSVPVNDPTSCTATVTDTSSGTPITPTGTIMFSTTGAGTFSPIGCTLSGGSCSVNYTPDPGDEGTDTLSASYGGDASHSGSASAGANSFSLTVTQRADSATLDCSPTSVPVEAPTTCEVVVSDTSPGTVVTPTGTVDFAATPSDNGVFSQDSCILSSGSCSVTYTPNQGTEGSDSISASFLGDTDHPAATPTPFMLTVTTRSTSTTVSCAPSSVAVDSATTCTVSVTDTSPGTTIAPSGTVGFADDPSGSGTFNSTSCTLSSGSCGVTYTPNPGSEGSISIEGTYSGDTDHAGSEESFEVTSTVRATSTSVSCTPVGAIATCTITVTDTRPGSPITPTGNVTMSDNGADGMFVSLSCSGSGAVLTCTVTYDFLTTPSTVTITATYVGDADHSGSSGSTSVTS
ncbi:MAG TPA: hypothetical protein VEJ36_06155 [Nitrososphaerales archaeon]|nr:hypothetical protein [Nitrososphaerales archaeon]